MTKFSTMTHQMQGRAYFQLSANQWTVKYILSLIDKGHPCSSYGYRCALDRDKLHVSLPILAISRWQLCLLRHYITLLYVSRSWQCPDKHVCISYSFCSRE